MPVVVDPETVLPEKKRATASQVISFLLYPVVFLVGATLGIAIGIREAPAFSKNKNTVVNHQYSNTRIIVTNTINSGKNTNQNSNSGNSNANTNTSSYLNTNIMKSGDYAKLDAKTEAVLQTRKQTDLTNLVDKTADTTDILRQQDLVNLKYNLETYFAVRGSYPTTGGVQVRLERGDDDLFYAAMKDFYGGSFYERIDPQSPQYYYGYSSDGLTYTLSAYLVSKKAPYYLSSTNE